MYSQRSFSVRDPGMADSGIFDTEARRASKKMEGEAAAELKSKFELGGKIGSGSFGAGKHTLSFFLYGSPS